jgi:hypothetical protein
MLNMNIAILATVPDIVLTGGIVAAGFVALILGWIIHPWTVGGFTRWVESPMQQFMARVGTAVVSAFAMVYIGGMMLAVAFPHWSFAKSFDKEGTSKRGSASSSGSTSSDDPFAEPQRMTPAVPKPSPSAVARAEQPIVAPPAQQSATLPVTPKKTPREIATTRPEPEVAEIPKEKTKTKPSEDGIKPSADSVQMKVAELKGELAALETKIQGERERWQEGVNVINRLTNFKKTPVREGSPQYHQCMAASRVIKEVEAGAAELKAEKARLEAMIKSLESK